ncbi:MAG: choice-of-anchor L domain-containing protein, partial [Flavobacteriales bacterium]
VSGNADLLDIANSVPGMINENFSVISVNDLCILEFDFIATGDTVKFNYAFGSDEYIDEFGTDYVNTQYNDIFAFFLSGPGISGPYDNDAINIAQVPGIEPPLPITISSVNQFLNTEFFIGNSTNVDICQNGFTVSIEASHPVTCGETYHIRLAIGDGSDGALESVVVLEAGSFTSNSAVEVDLSIDVGLPDENLMYEDCGLATLTFTRPIETILDVEEMVIISYTGTATNGVDYSLLPDTIVFAPGVQTVQFEVDAFIDDVVEGEEFVVMEILNLAACNGGGLTSYFEFVINDLPPTLVVDGYTINVCQGDTVEIEPIITGGYGNYSFEWETGEETPSIEVGPEMTSIYNVIVSDTCGMEPDDADIEVLILEFPAIDVTINGGDLLLDCNDFVEVTGQASGGDGNFPYEWQDQNGNNLFGLENSLFYGTGQGASEIHLVVTDGCGFTEETFINVNLTVPPIIIDLVDLVEVDCNEPFNLSPGISGGEMPYFNMVWYDGDGALIQFDQNLNFATGLTQTIQFQVTDACGQTETYDVDIVVNAPPVEVNIPDSFTGTCLDSFDLNAEVVGGLPGYEFEWTMNGALIGDTPGITVSLAETNEISITVSDACSTSGTATTTVSIVNPPVEVDLGEDIFTVCTTQSEIIPEEVFGLGDLSYSWDDGDVPFSDETSITYQTYESTIVTLQVTDVCGTVGSDEIAYNLLPTPIELTLSEDPVICAGDEATLTASAIGGEGDLSIHWINLNSFGEEEVVSPDFSQSYQVQVTDVCGNEATDNIFVEVQESFALFEYDFITESQVQFYASEESQCETCNLYWNFGDG